MQRLPEMAGETLVPRRSVLAVLLLASLGWLSAATAPPSLGPQVHGAQFKILRILGHDVRWIGRRVEGETFLTYRIVDRSLRFAGADNCRILVPPVGLAAHGISQQMFRRELDAAFAEWSRVARISFVEAAGEADADILIGAQGEPTGRAFAQVFFDTAGTSPVRAITRSLICLNLEMPWKIGFDGNLGVYDLKFTLTHEIGHAIGLDHPAEAGQLMWFRYDEKARGPQAGDVLGAALLYGARRPGDRPRQAKTAGPGVAAPGPAGSPVLVEPPIAAPARALAPE